MTAHTPLSFNVLGPLEVIRNEPGTAGPEPVQVPGGRQRAILACLLVDAGRPVRTDALVEAGWSDALPQDPRASLHTVISRLRNALDGTALMSGPVGYTLQVPDDAVDARRFEALCSAARGGSPQRAAELFAEALALWRGPAYAEHADRDFAAPEAARLERLRLDVIEEHAAAAIESGDHETAATELQALLTEHPFREHAVELLMTALYWAGRHAEALALFRAHRALLADELGLDPLPTLCDLEARILGQDLAPRRAGERALEAPAWLDTSTSFIGRETVLAELLAAVTGNRVVTVSGTGGVGKSRLVAQALPQLAGELGIPAVVVELAAVVSGQVVTAVADAVRTTLRSATAREDLVEYLSVNPLLLVLDNCEHLRTETAELVGLLARRCPRSRMVLTSRHRLGLASERILALEPLSVPDSPGADEHGEGTPSVQLFYDRARRLRPSVDVTSGEAAAVVEICRRLDGLPLALELAAARAAALGASQVLATLAPEGTVELAGLEDVVRWSTRLLTPEQRRLLGQLTVFVGRFDVAAVTAVGARLPPWTGCGEGALVAALAELVESHLLATETRDGRSSYRMLVLVRSFAERHLAEPVERERVQLAHAEWVLSVAEGAARDWTSGHAAIARANLERYGPDLVAALRWTVQQGRLGLAAATCAAIQLCLHWLPSQELGDLVIDVGERCAAAADRGLALGAAAGAMAYAVRGDAVAARRLAALARRDCSGIEGRFLTFLAMALSSFYSGDHEDSLTWLRRIEELPGLTDGQRVDPWVTAALVACYRDDLSGARNWVSAALTAADTAGAEAAYAFALYASGEIEVREDRDRGAALFRSAAMAAGRIGAAHVSQVAQLALLAVLVRLNRRDSALELAGPLLQGVHRVGSWPQVWTTLRVTSELLVRWGRWEDAALLLGAVDAAAGAPPLIGEDEERYARLRREMRANLGSSVLERIGEFGRGLPRAQVVDRAVTVLFRLSELRRPAAGPPTS